VGGPTALAATDPVLELQSRANALISKTPRIAEAGFGVICLAHEWDNIDAFKARFFPASLVLRVDLPHPVLSEGRTGRE